LSGFYEGCAKKVAMALKKSEDWMVGYLVLRLDGVGMEVKSETLLTTGQQYKNAKAKLKKG
jgi:hypothetical protein